MDSPPSSNPSHRGSIDSDMDLDDYFANYVPLSNLPTPPMVVDGGEEDHTAKSQPNHHSGRLETDLTGPATHLARLVPSNASVRRPCALTIQGYMYRSGLPMETMALAACILDALSFRFALHWRQACAKLPGHAIPQQQVATALSQPHQHELDYHHKRAVSAYSGASLPPQETIVLSALSIAHSVHDDRQWRARHWTRTVGDSTCSVAQFNATTMCILQDLDYNVHCFTSDMIDQAQLAMRRCVAWAAVDAAKCDEDEEDDFLLEDDGWLAMENGRPKPRPLQVTGFAVEQHGLMTPEPDS